MKTISAARSTRQRAAKRGGEAKSLVGAAVTPRAKLGDLKNRNRAAATAVWRRRASVKTELMPSSFLGSCFGRALSQAGDSGSATLSEWRRAVASCGSDDSDGCSRGQRDGGREDIDRHERCDTRRSQSVDIWVVQFSTRSVMSHSALIGPFALRETEQGDVRHLDYTPMARLGEVDEIAALVLFSPPT